jgi:hypothetical protein
MKERYKYFEYLTTFQPSPFNIMMKAKGHKRPPFSGRIESGHKIDKAMAAGNVKKAVARMQEAERRLTLQRREIGKRLRGAKTDKERRETQAEMDAINDVMDDLCFHIRDPKGFHAKNK